MTENKKSQPQSFFGLGALKVPEEDRKKATPYKALKMRTSPVDLPATYRLKRIAQNYYQNGYGMCVSMAISRFASHAYRTEFGKEAKFAPAFIYGNRISDTYTGEGMHTDKAITDFINNGVPFWDALPFIGTYPQCKAKITDDLKKKAKPQHALSSICMFPNKIFGMDRLGQEEITAIKTYIYEKQLPIIFIMDLYEKNFNECYKLGGKVGKVDFKNDVCIGSHAMVIEGWNDYGMIIANSWGDAWGDGTGDCNVSWEYNSYMDFWTMTDYIEPKPEPPTPPTPPTPPEPPKPPVVVIPDIVGKAIYNAKEKRIESECMDKYYKCTIAPDKKKKTSKKNKFPIRKAGTYAITFVSKDETKAKSITITIIVP